MRTSNDTPAGSEAPPERGRPRVKILSGLVIAGLLLLTGLKIAGVEDIIDLPAWANISGVDVPLVGDMDQIDCELEQIAASTDVQISIVDGDESTYDDYIYVFNNGEIHDLQDVIRVSTDTLISPSREYFGEQWYSIANEPLEESRVYCGSIIIHDPDE